MTSLIWEKVWRLHWIQTKSLFGLSRPTVHWLTDGTSRPINEATNLAKARTKSEPGKKFLLIGRLLWPQKVPRKLFFISHVLELKYFTGTNTFEHVDFKSEKFPLRRHAVFSQTAIILSSLISRRIFSLFNDTDRWRQTIISLKRSNFY